MPRELILFLSSTQNRNVGTPIRVAVIASIVERYLAWCLIAKSLVDQRLVPRCQVGMTTGISCPHSGMGSEEAPGACGVFQE